MTINKSQGQTLSRTGLDLRSSAFAHGQLYVAFSRAQNKTSITCLLPPSQVVDGVPYTENIVYSPLIQAATGVLSNKPSPFTPPQPPPPPNPPTIPVPEQP